MKKHIYFILSLFVIIQSYAQTPNSQDCNGALKICQSTLSNTNSIVGEGNVTSEITPTLSCLFSGEQNGVWYQFTVQSAGSLCFTIDPVNDNNDFDFGLFNLTNGLCSSIATTSSLSAACNYNVQTTWFTTTGAIDPSQKGNTGLFPVGTYTSANQQSVPCIPVTQGSSYALYVSSASLPNFGYTLIFPPPGTPGMASIFDATAPQLSSITSPTNCGISALDFTFSEDVLCNTVSASDFQITGPGGPYTITGISSTNCTLGGTKTSTFTANVTPALNTGGVYQLCYTGSTVSDPCGNTALPACLNFNINGPTSTFTASSSEVCSGTSITFTNTGIGTTHSWSFPGGSPSASSLANPPSVTWSSSGSYVVTHTATTSGCVSTTSQTIVVNPLPTATVNLSDPTCSTNTGSASVAVSGGTPGFSYNWLPSGGTTSSVTGLIASSNYTVQITDSKNCKVSKAITVGPLINTSAGFTASPNKCLTSNSFTFANTGSSSGIHSYSFDPSPGAPSVLTGSTVTASFSVTGTYTVTHSVNLGVGCVFTQTLQVTIFPSPTSISVTSYNTLCSQPTGSISISGAAGGVPGYQFNLNGGGYSGTTDYTGLSAGTYSVGVQDLNGCTFTNTVIITDTPSPTAITLSTTPSSCGTNNGSIIINGAVGGTPTYSFSFNNGPFTATSPITGLSAGNYTVSVLDANNCVYNTTVNVVNPLAPTNVALTVTNTACVGNTGIIRIGTVTGGTPTYSFSLDNGPYTTALTYTGQAFGLHVVRVRDGNNCTFTRNVNVNRLAGPSAVSVTVTPISCGGVNGAISIGAVTGGVPSYSFSVNGSPSGSTTVFTGLAAGVYTIVTRDGNGCVRTQTSTIIFNSNPTSSVLATSNVSCNGGSNGSATITASAGTPAYTYSINPIGSSNGTGLFSGLSAGSYTVTVKDVANCTVTKTISITEPLPLSSTITAQTIVSCFGGGDGSVTVAGINGSAPYQYSINGGGFQVPGTFSSLSAAGYSVTVKDNFGCTKIQNVVITEPPILSLTIGSSPANCNLPDGIAVVSPSGGTPAYSYTWSSGAGNSATSDPVAPGIYNVVVSDSKGCVQTSSVIVSVKGGAIVVISNKTNATCFGGTNGTISTSMFGPNSAPYTYTWVPSGGSASNATNLAAGSYTVIARNVFGCVSTATAIVNQPTKLLISTTSTAATCNGGNNAKASLSVSGSVPPYSYLWNPSGVTTNTISNVAGTYSCTVTDASGCSSTNTVVLSQPIPIAISPTFTLPGCGLSNGAISINNSTIGGTGPYTYLWSNSTTGQLINSISAGTYTCTVTDANLCKAIFPIDIANPASPTISVTTLNHVSCKGGNNGLVTILASGGTSPYIYTWSNGQNTPTATNLLAGTIVVTVKDVNNCSASQAVTINEPLLLSMNTTSINPKCVGNLDGQATAFPVGGTSPYNYSWTSSPTQTTSTATGLKAGNYIVTVTDANLCVVSQSVLLTDPAPLLVSMTSTNATCFGADNGLASVTTSNTIGMVSYLWSDPTSQTLPTASFLSPGNYSVVVTDGNNCKASGNVTITEPTHLTASITAFGNVSCNGGNNGYAQVSPSGGTSGYTYSWNNGVTLASANGLIAGNYIVTVTDSYSCTATAQINISEPLVLLATASGTNINCYSACDGVASVNFTGGTGPYNFIWQPSLQTTFTANNLCSGTHTVTVKDNNNCIATSTVSLIEPAALSLTATTVSSNCGQSNGSACAVVTGGVGPYTYLWSNGTFSGCNNGLAANLYTLSVTDNKNCSSVVTININDIAAPTVTITSSTNVSCYNGNNGSASANYSGGVGPYMTSWNLANQNVLTINNLTAGIYNFKVTDSAGCIGSAFATITQPTALNSLANNVSNLKCKSVCTGSASILVNGGTVPYSYSWNDPNNQTNAFANFLCAGVYTCVITDGNNCSISNTVSISEPPLLVVNSSTITPISCYGLSDGGIAITPLGGTPGYSYTWSPAGGNNSAAYNLASNGYSVVINDANNCSASMSFTISQPTQITGVYTTTNSTCFAPNGSASIYASGGTGPYNYSWNTSPIQTTALASGLLAGPWICKITDSYGCSSVQTVSVTNTYIPLIDSITFTKPICYGQLNGSIFVWNTLAVQPVNYDWSGPNTLLTTVTNSLNGIGAGTYSVQLRDGNNCITPGVVSVNQPSILSLNVSPTTTICYGQYYQIYAAGSGGTPPYTYNWGSGGFAGSGPHLVSPTASTIYPVYVTDANNCVHPGSQITLNVKPALTAAATNKTGCDQDSILLSASAGGGNGGPYSYSWSNGGTQQSTKVLGDFALSPNTYTVIVSDGCSTPAIKTVSVIINPTPTGSFVASRTSGCEDLDIVFIGTSSSPADQFNWSFGDGTTGTGSVVAHTYTDPGIFKDTLIITNSFGCVAKLTSAVGYIEVYPKPTAAFTMDPQSATILEPMINFTDQSTLATIWNWNFNDLGSGLLNTSTDPNPQHYFNLVGDYDVTLMVSNSKGCTDGVIHRVTILPEFVIYVPNAFTPDKNGKNDVFQPKGVGIDVNQYELLIFNRVGQLIFSSNNFMIGWNGYVKDDIPAKEDVYVWKITVTDVLGEVHKLIGNVTLLQNK